MKIMTYWSPVPELNMLEEFKLLLLWRENWAKAGFEPVVLNEYVARQHPYFEEFDAAVSKFPTVNPVAYEKACFHRWLALAQVGGGTMADYDCWNRSCTVEDAEAIDLDFTTFYQRGANGVLVPCLVSAGAEDCLWLCEKFASYVPTELDVEGQRPHLSDQNCLQPIIKANPGRFKCTPIVTGYGEEGWKDAKAVHFSNGSCTPLGKTPKYVHVPTLI